MGLAPGYTHILLAHRFVGLLRGTALALSIISDRIAIRDLRATILIIT